MSTMYYMMYLFLSLRSVFFFLFCLFCCCYCCQCSLPRTLYIHLFICSSQFFHCSCLMLNKAELLWQIKACVINTTSLNLCLQFWKINILIEVSSINMTSDIWEDFLTKTFSHKLLLYLSWELLCCLHCQYVWVLYWDDLTSNHRFALIWT